MTGSFLSPVFRTLGSLRKNEAEILRATKEKYDLLIEASGFGVFEWKNLEDPGTFVCSPRMLEICGLDPNGSRVTFDIFRELVHPEDRALLRWDSSSQQQGRFLEYRFLVRDQFRWFRTRRVIKFDENGGPVYMIGSVEDIHDHRLGEEKLRAMNQTLEEQVRKRTLQLETANEAKSRFLAHMSHEIRTPLGLILGFSELLAGNQSLNQEAHEYLNLIVKNGEILSRVVNDLLDLSKVEAGRLKLLFGDLRLSDLLFETQCAFQEKAQSKGLQFHFENRVEPDRRLVTDEIRLKQVIYNLLSNALKFTDKGSVSVICSEREAGRVFCLDVVDTGVGIPLNEQERVFGEYMRTEWADSTRTMGTGLGLRLAKSLAQAMGGDLELVFSAPQQGSHFRLTFLNQQEENPFAESARMDDEIDGVDLKGTSVFVLDDNVDNIRLAQIFLQKLGCSVRGFTDPWGLIDAALHEQPDLVFLDILMPELNGVEVFKQLRERGYRKSVWALTAYAMNDDIQQILNRGFDGYIRKPISLGNLRRVLVKEVKDRAIHAGTEPRRDLLI